MGFPSKKKVSEGTPPTFRGSKFLVQQFFLGHFITTLRQLIVLFDK